MTIPITAEAFAAIQTAFSGDWSSDIRPDGKGGYLLTLPKAWSICWRRSEGLAKIYSDAIIEIAK